MHGQKAVIHMELIQNFAILPKKLLYWSQIYQSWIECWIKKSYFCNVVLKRIFHLHAQEKKEVLVRNLVSLNMPSVTTNNIYNALVSLFDEKKILWEHCLVSLMDSCNVMHARKQKWSWEKAAWNSMSKLTRYWWW